MSKVLEQIFSVKNNILKTHKVLTILGLKIKFKRPNHQKLNLELQKKIDEIIYRNVFVDCIKNSNWLKNTSFCLIKAAANYSFIFCLYQILEQTKPNSILEFGLGQTSLLTSQYSDYFKKDLSIIEHNQDWINFFGQKLEQYSNHKIFHKNLYYFKLKGVKSDKYENLDDITQNKKYDLIIIDGPIGANKKYPRTNILDLIPNNLADNFVIILDDAERKGELNTTNLIFEKLKENHIEFKCSIRQGMKSQLIISSCNYGFIHWM